MTERFCSDADSAATTRRYCRGVGRKVVSAVSSGLVLPPLDCVPEV